LVFIEPGLGDRDRTGRGDRPPFVWAPETLKAVENYYSPLPETLTFESLDRLSLAGIVYVFSSPGEFYQIASGAYLSIQDYVHVPPGAGPLLIAPCPTWFKDAHWGKDLECELDLPGAIAKAKALLRDADPETDQQEKTPRWLKKFKKKHGYEWEPEFDKTRSMASRVLREGISVDRAVGLMDRYWNVRNKPPLPHARLRELVEAAYADNEENDCRELRWRWARDKQQEEAGVGSGNIEVAPVSWSDVGLG
jgi:hypothetical protein